MDSKLPKLHDHRRPAYGWGRLVVLVSILYSIIYLVIAAAGVINSQGVPVLGWVLTFLVGLVWVMICVGLWHNGRKMRLVASISAVIIAVSHSLSFSLDVTKIGWPEFGPLGNEPSCLLGIIVVAISVFWVFRSDPNRQMRRSAFAKLK